MSVATQYPQETYRRLIGLYVMFHVTVMPLLLLAIWLYGDAGLTYASETTAAMVQDANGDSPLDRLVALPG